MEALARRRPGLDWRIVLALVLLVFVVPIATDLVVSGPARAFGWVAADTFYYLVYAQRTLDSGVIGFDGQHWSNGFHPLWMAIVTALQAVQPGVGTYVDLYWVVALSVLFQAFALYLLARSLRRADGTLSSWFVGLPVGAYAALVCPVWLSLSLAALKEQDPWSGTEPLYGTFWTNANGMETSLVVLCYAALLFAFARWDLTDRKRAAFFGVLLAALTFSRLDHVFIAAPLWLLAAARIKPSMKERRAALAFAALTATFFGLVLVYMLANRLLFQSALPVSGRLKSTAPHLTGDNFNAFVQVYESAVGRPRPPIYIYWRVFQMLVPAGCALLSPLVLVSASVRDGALVLAWAGRPWLSQFLGASALGVLALAAYNFGFVPTAHQGHWYFPVSILFVSLVAFVAFERATVGLRNVTFSFGPLATRKASLAGSIALAMALASLSCAFFMRLHRHTDYNDRYAKFYFEEREKVRAAFRENPPHLLCFDDGIVAYVTGFPTMSGTGYSLDSKAAKAFEKGKLADLAIERGFNHLTSLVYVNHAALRTTPPNVEAWRRGAGAFGSLAGTNLRVAYASETMNFAIVEATKPGTSTGKRPSSSVTRASAPTSD